MCVGTLVAQRLQPELVNGHERCCDILQCGCKLGFIESAGSMLLCVECTWLDSGTAAKAVSNDEHMCIMHTYVMLQLLCDLKLMLLVSQQAKCYSNARSCSSLLRIH